VLATEPGFSITAAHLRSIAGPLYYRGEAYWREGRVASCTLEGRVLDGEVDGTQRYRVRVTATPSGGLISACSCPVGGLCKHAVALVLAYLGERAELPRPEPIAGAWATRTELDSWAREHRVEHALAVSAETLCAELTFPPQDYWIKTVLARLPLREVGALELAARHARARGVDVALAKAAYRALHREAAIVREAMVEEAARRPQPAEPGLAALWERLLELRHAARAVASPRTRAVRDSGTWKFDAVTAQLTWKEKLRVLRPATFSMVAVAARLSIDGAGVATQECTCGARDGRCTHVIALIDATLDVLEAPARTAEALAIADHLLRPGWARALAELERLDTGEPAAAALDVWWRIDGEPGALDLEPMIERRTKRGTSRVAVDSDTLLDDHGDRLRETDLRVAELLAGWQPGTRSTYPSRAFLALVGHPRVLGDDDEPIEVARAKLGFTALPAGDQIRLEPAVEGARLNPKLLTALLATFADGEPLVIVDVERRRWLLVEVGAEARRLWTALQTHGDAFPPESHTQLVDRLARIEHRVIVALPDELKGRRIDAEPTIVARLRIAPEGLEIELFVRPAPGAPLFPPGSGPRDVMVAIETHDTLVRGHVRRELDDEQSLARTLFGRLPIEGAEEGPPFCFTIGDPDQALAIVAAVQDPPNGLEAEWIDLKDKPVVRGTLGVDKLKLRVDKERDWFGLSGDVRVDGGRLELAILLDAIRRQQRYVRIDANRWIELSDALRARLVPIADQTYQARDRIELSPGAVPALRELERAGARVTSAPAWAQLADRLVKSRTIRPRVPAALRAKLRDYQIEGHAWLTRVAAWGAGACLADDMGLGKTVQAIAVLLDRARRGPALVLAPTSVIHNWADELARFAPTLRPVLYTETDRAVALATLRKSDVVIASYGVLVRDAAQLAAVRFATAVFDEAQALKNHTTQRARAARTIDAEFRIALSGTPFENHLGELWSLFAIVFPGLLGSWDQFRERYAIPIERHGDPDARAALARVLSPFLLRRTKREVARELPARTEIEIPVALSDDERALYEDARLAAVAELARKGAGMRDERRRFQVLAAITRLRLLASHPRLYDPTSAIASSKLARAVELLEELRAAGHRALVFSQFTSHLALVRPALEQAGFDLLYLDGATPARERKRLVAEFQAGRGDAFLISLKAGGQGINLTGADYVLHLDPWWNPAVEDQATDRAHRIGQLQPVTVYRLISRATIEERILALHRDKRALVEGVLAGTGAAARLTTKDLMRLLQAG